MPGRDGTGPQGRGPMTGRKLGPCNKEGVAESTQSVNRFCGSGRGFGCGRGFGGMGYRRCPRANGANRSGQGFGRGQGFVQAGNTESKE